MKTTYDYIPGNTQTDNLGETIDEGCYELRTIGQINITFTKLTGIGNLLSTDTPNTITLREAFTMGECREWLNNLYLLMGPDESEELNACQVFWVPNGFHDVFELMLTEETNNG